MNKATIVEDSITYIHELQKNVNMLQDQLFEMEAWSSLEEPEPEPEPEPRKEEADAAEEMKKFGIQVIVFCLFHLFGTWKLFCLVIFLLLLVA